jgi:murein DD-endopeptidase MepM/ murein hydrolase activator NlpD
VPPPETGRSTELTPPQRVAPPQGPAESSAAQLPATAPPAASAARPEAAAKPATAASPARSSGTFSWPVRGRILAGFGAGPDGTHNDGINIAAPRGSPVQAVDGGVVAYAGNELRGYGNLILIKHPDGWISAYAHCDLILVKRGQKVARGQVIARVGSTGNVNAPQLHFELRRGDKPVDPRAYLAPLPSAAAAPRSSG